LAIAQLRFQKGLAIALKGVEENLPIGCINQRIHIAGAIQIIGGETSGLFVTTDFVAGNTLILARWGVIE
jgi:hypothetical protein